jgi:hypothetical protein
MGIATGYVLDARGSVLGRDKIFFSKPQRPASYPMVPGADFPGVKWTRREADCSPPSSAEVKNGGATPPLPSPKDTGTTSPIFTFTLIKNLDL